MAVPVINSATRAGGNVGTAFSYFITATNSPTSFSASLAGGGLPAGLSIDTASGELSGTPTVNAISAVRMTATNGDGTSAAVFLDLHISRAGAPVITSAETAAATAGSGFVYNITATNTPTGYNATSLPLGLMVNTSTGAITGTPTLAGTYNVKITAQNSFGKDSDAVSLVVSDASGIPVITSSQSVSITVGFAHLYQITATNSPTSFGASNLPPGLLVDVVDGEISGTPTTAGIYTSTVTATNGTGTGEALVTFTVSSVIPGDQSAIPTGLALLMSMGRAPTALELANANLDAISLAYPWSQIERVSGLYDFSFFRDQVIAASAAGKKVILKVETSGGARRLGGNTPDHVFTAMGVNSASKAIVPGVTYTFNSGTNVICIPVFWNATFVARKAALYTAMGDYFANTTELTATEKDAVKVVHGSFANALNDKWYVPHGTAIQTTGGPDGTGYPLNERDRWLFATNAVPNPGAGYTTALMYNAGITLLGTILDAFPGKFCVLDVGPNGTELDVAASGGVDTTNYLAKDVASDTNFYYTDRLLLHRGDVSTIMPLQSAATGTEWQLMDQWQSMGDPVAAGNLWFIAGDTTYLMNNGVADTPSNIFRTASERAAGYNLHYLEVWQPDFARQSAVDLAYVRALFFTGALPNPPVITSEEEVDSAVGQDFSYQITATNNPIGYTISTDFGTDFRVNTATGLVTGRPRTAAVLVGTMSATNAGGTGTAGLTITITAPGTGETSEGGPDESAFTNRVTAFPESTSFAEDTRVACPDYALLYNQSPPSPPVGLIVTTPQRPNSGTATATWGTPLKT